MQSLINKLFNGNTMPESEKLIDSKPFKRNTALDNADKKERELLKTFNDEQKSFLTNGDFFQTEFGATKSILLTKEVLKRVRCL